MNGPVRVIRVRPVETREALLPAVPDVGNIEDANILAVRKYMAECYVAADGSGHVYRRMTTAWLYDAGGPDGRKLSKHMLPAGRVAWASRTDRLALGTEIRVLDGNDDIVFAETVDAFENLCGRDYRTAAMAAPMLSDEYATLRAAVTSDGTLDVLGARIPDPTGNGAVVPVVLRGIPFAVRFTGAGRASMNCLPVTMPDGARELKFIPAGGTCFAGITMADDPDGPVDTFLLPVSAGEAAESLQDWNETRK